MSHHSSTDIAAMIFLPLVPVAAAIVYWREQRRRKRRRHG